eukprot:CAMPEP_0118954258 /NCGR_PEP_ID=MMETSP1169-20130426/57939_1 /TAXON_ID=36882 /ORGANISM="Pyramimonas obovata, Strain CCMP722" /LENGTH=76 /DNA_ID=CAMNT_0006901863 /DNA_START=244 /DNA_END=474 /DNA_ORIENTATION=-
MFPIDVASRGTDAGGLWKLASAQREQQYPQLSSLAESSGSDDSEDALSSACWGLDEWNMHKAVLEFYFYPLVRSVR